MQKLMPLGIGVFLILCVVGAYFFFDAKGKKETVPAPDTATPPSSNPAYTITEFSVSEGPEHPPLDRPVEFSDSIPAEARTIIEKNVRDISARLASDPTNGGEWFDLAIQYHQANDYEGARIIWEFLTKAIPKDTTAYDNLGKLYHYSLKDYAKSESYFKKSLELNPDSQTPYYELFNLYRYSYKTDTSAAADSIAAAKKRFPGNTDPYLLLAGYYRDQGDAVRARTEYEAALDIARAEGDVSLIGTIGNELSNLPQ